MPKDKGFLTNKDLDPKPELTKADIEAQNRMILKQTPADIKYKET